METQSPPKHSCNFWPKNTLDLYFSGGHTRLMDSASEALKQPGPQPNEITKPPEATASDAVSITGERTHQVEIPAAPVLDSTLSDTPLNISTLEIPDPTSAKPLEVNTPPPEVERDEQAMEAAIKQADEEIQNAPPKSKLAIMTGLAKKLAPLVAIPIALFAKDSHKKAPMHLPSPPPPFPSVPYTPEHTGGVTTEAAVAIPKEHIVKDGESITGIIGTTHPEKYLNADGSLKTDEITKADLYSDVVHVLITNRKALEEHNPGIYQRIDKMLEEKGQITGVDLMDIIKELGGPSEVVLIYPGQTLTLQEPKPAKEDSLAATPTNSELN